MWGMATQDISESEMLYCVHSLQK